MSVLSIGAAAPACNEPTHLAHLRDRLGEMPTVRRRDRFARFVERLPNFLRSGREAETNAVSPTASPPDLVTCPEPGAGRPERTERMDPKHLLELREKEMSYWWHVNKRRLVMELLRRCVKPGASILEVGCGGGLLSAALAEAGWREVAADISYDAARFARERGATDALVFDAADGWPFDDDTFDALFMLDVLEHLDDDVAALTEARRVLRPGGTLILTVPAHQFLFSSWDRLVGHKRRYSRRRLARAARSARLRPTRMTAWNLISFVPALLFRTKDRLLGSAPTFAEFPAVSPGVNACLKWLGRLEGRLARKLNLRFGLSLAAVLTQDEELL